MKIINRLLRIVAVVTMLSLFVVAMPGSPASAAEAVTLSPGEGGIGKEIKVTGEGFRESKGTTGYLVYIFLSPLEADIGDDIDDLDTYHKVQSKSTDADGKFETSFYVPGRLVDGDYDEDIHGGTYYVYTAYGLYGRIKSKTTFTVIVADITIDPTVGPVATEVEITGKDFNGREYITAEYDGEEIDIESGVETESDGDLASTILVPDSAAGKHTITVTDETGSTATAEFTVVQKIAVIPDKAAPGEKVTVRGTGFGADTDVSIKFDGDEVATDWTYSYGSFEVAFTVPAKSLGTYAIEAKDSDGNKYTADFTVAAGLNLSQTTGNVGTEVTVNGAGFRPNATVTITYAPESTPVATPLADAVGKFSVTFTVPKSKAGAHTIAASDGTSRANTTFTMESTPPPVPRAQLPLDGTKAKSPAHFDWDDVTDPSGVTYTLQIATDEEFTDIILEKTDITASEYTLTRGDPGLKSTERESPYYWRVKAVDGADNASDWTSPASFYVGFGLTGWMLYLLIGVAGLVLLAICLWIVMRLVRR